MPDPLDMQGPDPHGPPGPRSAPRARTSLIAGLIGVCLAFIPLLNLVAFIPGIIAIVTGGKALAAVREDHTLRGKGLAIAGLILGILVVLYMITLLIVLFFVIGWENFLDDLRELGLMY